MTKLEEENASLVVHNILIRHKKIPHDCLDDLQSRVASRDDFLRKKLEVEALTDRLREYQHETEELRGKVSDLQHDQTRSKLQKDHMTKKIAQLSADVTRLQTDAENMTLSLAKTQEELASRDEELQKIRSQLKQRDVDIENQNRKLNESKVAIQKLEAEIRRFKSIQTDPEDKQTAVKTTELTESSCRGFGTSADDDSVANAENVQAVLMRLNKLIQDLSCDTHTAVTAPSLEEAAVLLENTLTQLKSDNKKLEAKCKQIGDDCKSLKRQLKEQATKLIRMCSAVSSNSSASEHTESSKSEQRRTVPTIQATLAPFTSRSTPKKEARINKSQSQRDFITYERLAVASTLPRRSPSAGAARQNIVAPAAAPVRLADTSVQQAWASPQRSRQTGVSQSLSKNSRFPSLFE